MSMLIKNSSGLQGTIEVAGDKSISHRAVMLGSIAKGTTQIQNFLYGEDCLSTIECFKAMGVDIRVNGTNVSVRGASMHGLSKPDKTLYTGNSGTTTRMMSGILAGQNFECEVTGDSSIKTRPMNRILTPLTQMGANISSDNGRCPLKFYGNNKNDSILTGIEYTLPVASAQLKSAVLLAGLYAKGDTTVIEKVSSRNHTETMLKQFGADITVEENRIRVSGKHELVGCNIYVPSDISSAAFFIVAGLIVPNSCITIKNVGINSTRAGIIDILKLMGGDIEITNKKSLPEPYADITVKTSKLTGVNIGGAIIPNIIDEIPILAVACAFAEGTSVITDASELKVKECDRINAMVTELKKAGVDIVATDDGMIINGDDTVSNKLVGAEFDTYNDHRVAMSLSVFALAVSNGDSIIKNDNIVAVSFPDFFTIIEKLQDSSMGKL